MSANQPMLGLMEKRDMKGEGRKKGYFLLDGKCIDVVFMSLNYDRGTEE